ncbi:hypothetical protein HELRODRAFT_163594 [Helobdella robusta]|uniref:Transmembrane protein 231 n=1 Tax=Helobdella robusta TaxID=6412 RepID=T1EU95_HELRO|nr:hypothetical protein HELRODRAFT_163594 [Helobdella robusta]ESN96524.1 hypothetical protein HELRODRAFT_163594 [Helobdella robusta]
MALITFYQIPKTIKYKSNVCSCATFITVLLFLLTFIPPLIIVLLTENFLNGINTGYERPIVYFNSKLLCYLKTDQHGNYITWSTFPNHQFIEASQLRVPNATSVTTFKMESMGHIGFVVPPHCNNLELIGRLVLLQNVPITFNDTLYEAPVINQSSLSSKTYQVVNVLKHYNRRKVRTQLTNQQAVWRKDADEPNKSTFTVKLIISYDAAFNFYYYQTIWEQLKWFWVVYLAILIPFYWVFGYIRRLIFTNHMVITWVAKGENFRYGTRMKDEGYT